MMQICKIQSLRFLALLRVYAKFGLADFKRTKTVTHFNQPFRAEMLSLYIIREFSIHLVEHIAYYRNPKKAIKLDNKIKQHLGIGNATGLGMAPFVIKHPKLIHKWISQFENVLNEIKKIKFIEKHIFEKYIYLLKKAQNYLSEVVTTDEIQKEKNTQAFKNLKKISNLPQPETTPARAFSLSMEWGPICKKNRNLLFYMGFSTLF